MLPLLTPDDDAHERYHSRYNGDDHRHQHHQRHYINPQAGNGAINNLSAPGADTEQEADVVVVAGAAPNSTVYLSSSLSSPATTIAGAPTKPTSKSRPFSSKTVHHLKRETDLTYAQPTSSPTYDNASKHGGISNGATTLGRTGMERTMGGATGGGNGGGGGGNKSGGGGHKSVTPQSFGLDTEAGARLIVGRAPPVPTASKSSSSGVKLAAYHGHDQLRQPSSRSPVQEYSAPRITKLKPSPAAACESGGWPSCGGIIPSGDGVTYKGGVTSFVGVNGNVGVTVNCGETVNGGVIATGGSGCNTLKENSKDTVGRGDINNGKNRDGCFASGEERSGGGRGDGGGAKHSHGVNIRFQNGGSGGAAMSCDSAGGTATIRIPSRGGISASSDHRGGAHQRDSATVSGNNHQQEEQQKQQRRQQQQHQLKSKRVVEGGHDVGEDRGTLLPGPEGCVEVRELEEGVLVVRRTWHEKKQSPERLNLHRRNLKSCPLVQVSDDRQG